MPRLVEDWIKGFQFYSKNSEPPPIYLEWVAVSCIAAALQRKCYLKIGQITAYPHLYVVLVGPAGCRKGTAMGYGIPLLNSCGIPLAAQNITREALVLAIQRSRDQIIDADGNSVTHSSLTAFCEELSVFLGRQNYELLNNLTDWWDFKSPVWTNETKNKGTERIEGIWLNLLGAMTPDQIKNAVPLDAIGSGFTSRIIFVYEPKKGKVAPLTELSREEREMEANLRSDLEQIRLLSGRFRITEEYLDRWVDFYTEQEHNPPLTDKYFDGYLQRRGMNIFKLSMIASAARRDTRIVEVEDLEYAIDLLQRTEVNMPLTFSRHGRNPDAELIKELAMIFLDNAPAPQSVKTLMPKVYRDTTPHNLEMVLDAMEKAGFLAKQAGDSGIEYTWCAS